MQPDQAQHKACRLAGEAGLGEQVVESCNVKLLHASHQLKTTIGAPGVLISEGFDHLQQSLVSVGANGRSLSRKLSDSSWGDVF
jgi:hypothetical protein